MRFRARTRALVGGANRRVGAKDRPADAGDRFFAGVLAAHRGTADAAGIAWKSAIYRKVAEAVSGNGGLRIRRMLEWGRASRSSFYRFDPEGQPGTDRDMELRDAIQRIAREIPS
jgi:hypothetical protein